MRIPEGYSAETAAAQARRTEAAEVGGKPDAAAQGAAGTADEVRWSQLADTLRAGASSDPPGRAERLARLAADYASGRLQPDGRMLSRSIVEGALAGA